ncbi:MULTISPECIES: hypothetical protein [unclassified Ketobacter]|uniref:hypothetical protein n=1 Tax=unclassified Ketobacter TaxID=2639109 RepID=UPI0025C6A259|nr:MULTISPECIES: hypothetical protein [unclassified Ketobacter]
MTGSMLIVMGLVGLMVSQSALAVNFYRYENDDGRKVMTQTLPPNVVHRGYEVLNERGTVIKVVPRALTEEELEALADEQKQQQLQAEQQERDKQLLAIFSSPKDAERALGRKLEAIDVYINVTKGNIAKLQGEFNSAQAQAAERERSGQEVPDFLISKMESFARQIREAEESIAEKEQEKVVIRKEYQKDIERLKYLMEQRQQAGSE